MSAIYASKATYTLTQARAALGEVINSVRHSYRTIRITDHGKAVVAIVPVERLEYLEQIEVERDIAEARRAQHDSDTYLVSHAEAAARFGLAPNGRPL